MLNVYLNQSVGPATLDGVVSVSVIWSVINAAAHCVEEEPSVELNPGVFRAELSRARTFGFMRDVEKLWACGRALGASLENTVALDTDRILNPEGLRYTNEFVRHKALDAIGDLALSGAPLLAAYRSKRGGHRLNTLMLRALFADASAWTVVQAPRTRDIGRPEAIARVASAMLAADRS